MDGSTSYKTIVSYFPDSLRKLISKVNCEELDDVMEIRIRAGGTLYFVFPKRIMYLLNDGRISAKYSDNAYIATNNVVSEIIERLCHYSVHSCSRQLSEGFFVIENGVRVGISGVYSSSEKPQLYEYCSLNFRIPRCISGCADEIFSETFDKNILICGGVNSGKTTLLRELCRLNGNFRKVTLIDERNEIACVHNGIPQNDVGCLTDTIVNTERSYGIMSAVRTLSPEVIFCDEIASHKDSEAILNGISCGVRFVVTAHGRNMQELSRRRDIACLLESGMIDIVCFLHGSLKPSTVREVIRLGNSN